MATRGRQNSQVDRLKRGYIQSNDGDRFAGGDSSRRSYDNKETIPSRKVYVSHFPYHFEAEDLSKVFCEFGDINEINIVKSDNDKRYGFITFSSIEGATRAKSELHGAPPLRLIVNYAKQRDDSNYNFNDDGKMQRNRTLMSNHQLNSRQRSKSVGPNRTSSYSVENNCIRCGDTASCKCSSCGAKYCSHSCQSEDWPNHMIQCVNKPVLVSLSNQESIDLTKKSSNLLSPRDRIMQNTRLANSNREPSVNELVKEITNEYKMSNKVQASNNNMPEIPKPSPISPPKNDGDRESCISPENKKQLICDLAKPKGEILDNSQHVNGHNRSFDDVKLDAKPVCNINDGKNVNNPMYRLIEQLKRSKISAPVIQKKPWEETELLAEGCFTPLSIVYVNNDGTYYAILKDKEDLSLEIITKANTGEFELEQMFNIEIGQLCLVCNDGILYRGRIVNINPYKVNLLDFGNDIDASADDLYQAPNYFADIPAQAMHIKILNSIKPLDLYNYIEATPTGKIIDNVHMVLLQDGTDKINEPEQVRNTQDKVNDPISKSIETSDAKICPRSEVWKKTVSLPDTFTKVHVTMVDGEDYHVNIFTKMQDIVVPLLSNANNCAKVLLENIIPDTLCLVEFECVLYRAVIRSVKPAIKAFLLDYGNVVCVKKHQVFCAPDVHAGSPGQAIHVRLAPGTKSELKLDDEVAMKTIDKVDDVHIVQIEGDIMDSTSKSKVIENKTHAIEYLDLNTKGSIVIAERPCSNKFSLTINIPEILDLQKDINMKIKEFTSEKSIIKEPSQNDIVIAEVNNSFVRSKVLQKKHLFSYVSLLDLGIVVKCKTFYDMPSCIKDYPSLSCLGTIRSFNCDQNQFEHCFEKDEIQFSVKSIKKTVIVKCNFLNNSGICFDLELRPWEPLIEQVHHGRIYLDPLTKCQVNITHFANQKAIYIKKTTAELEKLYEQDLQNCATYGLNAKPLLTLPIVNELVLAKFDDGVFYKAIVKEVNGDDISVLYTAFGNTDVVKFCHLREISDNLKKTNLFIRKVGLAEVSDGPLTTSVTSLMNNIINTEPAIEFTMKPGKSPDDNSVYLLYPEGASLNDKVSNLLTPIWHDIKNMTREKAEDTLLNQDVLMKTLIKEPHIPTGSDVELFIVDTTNLVLNVFFACVPDQDCLINMMIDVPAELKNYAMTIDMPYNPRIDELCIAKFEEANGEFVWHRAYCLSHEGESCYLASIDIGIMQYVQIQDIRRMSPDFIDLPSLSSMFFIQGLPEPPLSEKAVDILKEVLKACNSTVKFAYVKKEQDGSYSVRLEKSLLDSVLAVS